jgi:phosphoenolpyruvate carboxykinase (GTP)
LERCAGHGDAVDSPIGWVPSLHAINRDGIDLTDKAMTSLLKVDPAEWVEAVAGQEHFLNSLGEHLPAAIREEHTALAHRIHDAITPPDLHGRDLGS